MTQSFCKGWFIAKKKITQPWPEEKARTAHQAGEPYTVVLGSPEQPDCFIEVVAGEFAGVTFLDDRLRPHVRYAFQKKDRPGWLFLSEAIYRDYDGETDKVVKAKTYRFDTGGHVFIEDADILSNLADTWETHYDVSGNWERVPSFGHYQGVAQFERAPAAGHRPG